MKLPKIAFAVIPILALGVGYILASSQPTLPQDLRYPYSNLLEARAKQRTALYQQEIGFYLERIGRNPDDGLDRAALAGVYLKRARVTGEATSYLLAEQSAERSLSALPTYNAAALTVLAEVALAQHDFAQTQVYIAELQKISPHSAGVLSLETTLDLALGRVEVAAKKVQQLSGGAPNINTLLLRGFVHEASGKNALLDYRAALQLEEADDPVGSARVRTFMARWYARHGQYSLAQNLLLEAVKIVPNDPQALLLLADNEALLGNLPSAEARYLQLADNAKKSVTTYNHAALRGLARLARLGGRDSPALWQEAAQNLRLELQNSALGHRRELAALLLEWGQKQNLPEALKLATEEAQIRQDAETLHTLAWAQLESGQPTLAQKTMQQALKSGIQDAVLFYRMGNIEAALGQSKTAAQWYTKALGINPQLNLRFYALKENLQ